MDMKVEHKFAWIPALIRNNAGQLFIKKYEWVWLKKYTRISVWGESLGRYRTVDTVLGHVEPPSGETCQ